MSTPRLRSVADPVCGVRGEALALWCLAGLACTDARAGSPPTLRYVDSVALEESDTLYLGEAAESFTVDSAGDIFVPDRGLNQLLRFSPSGQYRARFGRAGRGPGEFPSMGPATLLSDSLLFQSSAYQIVNVYDRRTGEPRFRLRFSGYPSSVVRLDSLVFWGVLDHSTRLGVARLPLAKLVSPPAPADSAVLRSNAVPWPPEYAEFPNLDTYNDVHLAGWADTLVVGFGGVNRLVVALASGEVVGEIEMPVTRRRGVSREALQRFRRSGFEFERAVGSVSGLAGLWRLPTGHLLVWHQDAEITLSSERVSGLRATAWISVLAPDLRSACVDARLPDPSAYPRLTLRADTLYALDHVVVDADSPRGRSVVRKYAVSLEGCAWQAAPLLTPP